MHRMTVMAAAFLAAGAATALAAGQAAPGLATTQVLRTERTTAGQRIAVPAHPTVIVSIATIAVGGRTPVHKHPYQRYVYVLAGELTVSTVPGHGAMPVVRHYKAGDFLPEMRDMWHFGSNAGADEVKLLVIDQVPAGTTTNIVLKTP